MATGCLRTLVLRSRPLLAPIRVHSWRWLSTSQPTDNHRVAVSGRTVPMARKIHMSAANLNEHIVNVQDPEDFKTRVLNNATPVVVDFYATWCGPCKLLGPRLESLIASKNGKVILAKIDIDEMTDLAVSHGVEAVPTVIGMKNGKVIDKFVGVKDDADLESFIGKLIN